MKPEIIDNLEKAYETYGIKRSMNLRVLKKSEKLIEAVLRTDFVQNRDPELDTAGVIADVILLCELTASGNAPCAPAPESPDKVFLHKLNEPIGLYNKPTNEILYNKYETLNCVHSLQPMNSPEEYHDDINAQLYIYQKAYFPETEPGKEARNILENSAVPYDESDEENRNRFNTLCRAAKKNALGFSRLSEINKQQERKLASTIPGFFEKDTGNGNEIIQINNLIDMNSTNQNTIIVSSLLKELVHYCDRAENNGIYQLRLLLGNLIPKKNTDDTDASNEKYDTLKEQLNKDKLLSEVVCQLNKLIDNSKDEKRNKD